MTDNEFVQLLNSLDLRGKLEIIRDHSDLSLVHDNGWFFVERNGHTLYDVNEEHPEGFGELFARNSEMNILLSLAGL